MNLIWVCAALGYFGWKTLDYWVSVGANLAGQYSAKMADAGRMRLRMRFPGLLFGAVFYSALFTGAVYTISGLRL